MLHIKEIFMSYWHTVILPFILGPPVLLAAFTLLYVFPKWINSFDKDEDRESS